MTLTMYERVGFEDRAYYRTSREAAFGCTLAAMFDGLGNRYPSYPSGS